MEGKKKNRKIIACATSFWTELPYAQGSFLLPCSVQRRGFLVSVVIIRSISHSNVLMKGGYLVFLTISQRQDWRIMSEVFIKREMLSYILKNAQEVHPREILLLRGKTSKNQTTITDLIVPPLATHGKGFSGFQSHMLPIDFSLGTAHSHPSGVAKPSLADLHHSFGRIIMIAAFPYNNEENVAVHNHSGEKLTLKIA
jgi:proteasome lid subunit RPN8/RPN11